MFNAIEANSLMLKVRDNKLDTWEKLQNEIRWRAFHGYDFFYLTNENYLNLFTILEMNGYEVAYNKDAGLWYCSWA